MLSDNANEFVLIPDTISSYRKVWVISMNGVDNITGNTEMNKIMRENPAVAARIESSGNVDANNAEIKSLKRAGIIECETCANRKYKDGSDEMVSFKAPGHISPQESAAKVRSHEQEHVSNAYSKASTGNGQVINCSVSLSTAVCPECGRSYVSGGLTSTQIKYNKDNPYDVNKKSLEADAIAGSHVDLGG